MSDKSRVLGSGKRDCSNCANDGNQRIYPGKCTGCGAFGELKNYKPIIAQRLEDERELACHIERIVIDKLSPNSHHSERNASLKNVLTSIRNIISGVVENNGGDFAWDRSPEEFRIDSYHEGVKGGFDTSRDICVRITHLPTMTTTESSGGRSLHANKAEAMRKMNAELDDIAGAGKNGGA